MYEKFYGKAKDLLITDLNCGLFPTIDERDAWERMPKDQKDTLVELGEQYMDYQWPTIPATEYMRYAREGNRLDFERPYCYRRTVLLRLVMAECVENKGRFIDDIINGFWVILDESTWVASAHNNNYPPVELKDAPLPQNTTNDSTIYVDHFAGDAGTQLAVLAYIIRPRLDAVTPMVYERIVHELHRRIIRPFVEHDDFGWMGSDEEPHVSNWLPWCVSNCLCTTAMVCEDADLRDKVIEKAMRLNDRYMRTVAEDGGCEEGSRYSLQTLTTLFACAEIMHAMTNGKICVYDDPKLRAFSTFISKMHIDGNQFTMFADADRYNLTPTECAWIFARHVENKELEQLALAMRSDAYYGIRDVYVVQHVYYRLREIFSYADFAACPPVSAPYEADCWYPGIQMVMARENPGKKEGLFFAAKGGTNGEHHNHNDIGSFMLYSDGCPAVIDMGAGDYTATSFGPLRYIEHPQTASSHHNLPMVNGVQQKDGVEYKATNVTYENRGDDVRFGLNIESAYPAESGMHRWHREFVFDRAARSLTVEDTVDLQENSTVELVLMTWKKPEWADGVLRIPVIGGRDVLVSFCEGWIPTTQRIDVGEDAHFAKDWGEHVYRTVYRTDAPMKNGVLTMMFTQAAENG